MYPQECFAYHKRPFWPILCLKKDWVTLPRIIYCYRYLLVTNYLAIKLLAAYNFSACKEYLAKNHLSFPSAPRWVRHSYLSKRATIDPLYLWVIKAIFWRRCRGVKRLW